MSLLEASTGPEPNRLAKTLAVDGPAIDVQQSANLPVAYGKGIADIAIGSLALVALSPVMIAAAVLVAISSPGPILFRQTRIGGT